MAVIITTTTTIVAALPAPDGTGRVPIVTEGPEPGSAGEPPVAPAMVERAVSRWAGRAASTLSGHTATLALATASAAGETGRAGYTVRWKGLTLAERDLVAAFLVEQVGILEKSFTVTPDGAAAVKLKPFARGRESAPHATRLDVRPVEVFQERHAGRGAYDIDVETEEVY